MMYFKRVKNPATGQPFSSAVELAEFSKEVLTKDFSQVFSKVEVFEQFLLLQINEKYLMD